MIVCSDNETLNQFVTFVIGDILQVSQVPPVCFRRDFLIRAQFRIYLANYDQIGSTVDDQRRLNDLHVWYSRQGQAWLSPIITVSLKYLVYRSRRSCSLEAGRHPCDTSPPVCLPEASGRSSPVSPEGTCRCQRTPVPSKLSRWMASRWAETACKRLIAVERIKCKEIVDQ